MHKLALLRSLALFLALAVTAPCLSEGLYWESTTTGGLRGGPGGDQPRLSKTYAMPKKFKREDSDSVILVRLDKEVIYMLKPKDKTYTEMTFADIEKMSKAASEQMDKLSSNPEFKKQLEKLKDLPPEQRALVEKQLGNNPLLKGGAAKDAKVEVSRTDEKRDIAGHSCVKYVAKEDGKDVMTAWTTRDFKEFAALREDWVAVMNRMSAVNPMMGKNRAQAFEKLEGFPLETEISGVKTTVTKVEPRSTADTDFEVPAGYTKTQSPLERALPGLKGAERKGLGPKPGEPKAEPKE